MLEFKVKVIDGLLTKFESITDCKVYNSIVYMSDHRYIFINNEYNRKLITEKCNLADVTVRKSIKRLYESNLLIKTEESNRGIYFINKDYVTFPK
jgi:predicted transcriptional regulator